MKINNFSKLIALGVAVGWVQHLSLHPSIKIIAVGCAAAEGLPTETARGGITEKHLTLVLSS